MMVRLLYLSCAMSPLWNLHPVCVQERAFVSVTITSQAPSALGTIIQLTLDIHTSELDMPTGDAEVFLASLRSDPAGVVCMND